MKGERTIQQLGNDLARLTPRAIRMELDGIQITVGNRNAVVFPDPVADAYGRGGTHWSSGVTINQRDRNLTERQIRAIKARVYESVEKLRSVYTDFLAQFAPEAFLDILEGKPSFDALTEHVEKKVEELAKGLPMPRIQNQVMEVTCPFYVPAEDANGNTMDIGEGRHGRVEVANYQVHARSAHEGLWTGRTVGGTQQLYYFAKHLPEFLNWYAELHVRLTAFNTN